MKFGIFFIAASREQNHQRDYEEMLEQAEYAEALGFDSLWVAEHHSAYGTIPSPPVLLAALAQRTKRVRLGSSVSILPFQNPVRTAEEYAMVDVLSGGRLNFGVGRGNQPLEYHLMRATMESSREVFWESLDIILGLWNKGRISYHGKHFDFDDIEIYPKPIQKPVPVWIAAISPETYPLVAERGLQLNTAPLGGTLDEVKERIIGAARVLIAHGRDPATIDFPMTTDVHIARTAEAARAEFREPLHWMRQLNHGWHPLGPVPKGYEAYAERHLAPLPDPQTLLNERLAQRNLIAADPAGAIAYLQELERDIGLKHFVCAMTLGGIEHRKVMQSMKLFAEEVMPAFAHAAPVPEAFTALAR